MTTPSLRPEHYFALRWFMQWEADPEQVVLRRMLHQLLSEMNRVSAFREK